MSLIRSLINHFLVFVSSNGGSGAQGSFFHQVNFTANQVFYSETHPDVAEKTYRLTMVKFNQQIYIALRRFFIAGKRITLAIGIFLCHSPISVPNKGTP